MVPARASITIVLASAFLWGPRPAAAQEQGRSSTRPATRGARDQAAALRAICGEYELARGRWLERYAAARDEAARARLLDAYPAPGPYCERLFRLIDEDPRSEAAGDALVWITRYGRTAAKGASLRRALELLAAHHLGRPDLGRVCLDLRWATGPELRHFLEKVATESPVAAARGQALFALAESTKRRAQQARRERLAGRAADGGEAEALRRRARALFRRVQREAAGVPFYGKRTLGQAAAAALYELEHLLAGMPAPDIAGEDIDGRPFRLSDYRGRVVMLDFWGDW